LGLSIKSGIIKRMDFGFNIVVDHKVELYHLGLIECKRYRRNTFKDFETVEFTKGKRKLVFYNKINELPGYLKRKYSRSILKKKNIIRYEIRLIKLLGKAVKLPQNDFLVSDLYSKKIYRRMIKLWYREYKGIKKSSRIIGFSSFENFHHYLEVKGIEAIGGLEAAFQEMNAWCANGKYASQKKIK